MVFSKVYNESLPILVIPAALVCLKITYEVLPVPLSFLAFSLLGYYGYIWYTGNSSATEEMIAKRANAKAEQFIEELNFEEEEKKLAAESKKKVQNKKAPKAAKKETEIKEVDNISRARSIPEVDSVAPASDNIVPKNDVSKNEPGLEGSESDSDQDSDSGEDEFLKRAASLQSSKKKVTVRR